MKYEISAETLNKLGLDDNENWAELLKGVGFYAHFEYLKGSYVVLFTDGFPIIFLDYKKLFNIDDFDVNYKNVYQVLVQEFEQVKFNNLTFNDCGFNNVYFDEFIATIDFTNLNKCIEDIKSDIKLIQNVVSSFEIIKPINAGLVKKQSENVRSL